MQRGFVGILVLVVVIIAALGGAFYLARQSTLPLGGTATLSVSPTPASPDASPVPNGTGETANWKTYTNIEHGYSLKYPSNWENDLDRSPGGSLNPPLPDEPPGGGSDYLFSGISVYEINQKYNPEGLSFEEYVEKDSFQGEGVNRTVKKLSLGSLEGLEVTQFWGDLSEDYPFKFVYIKHNSKIYTIRLDQHGSFPEVMIHVNTFNQILSTFRFK